MGEKKETVLVVHNYYQIPGGEDSVVANEKKMLEENGHKVVLYTRHNLELNQFSKFQKILMPIAMVFNLRSYQEIKQIIKTENIDVVHVHNTLSLVSQSVYYAARSCNVPVVQTIHNFRMLCPAATFYRDGHICEDCVTNGLKCAIKHNCYRNSKLQTLACVVNTKIHRMTGIYKRINYICLTEFNKEKLLHLKQIGEQQVYVKPNFAYLEGPLIPHEERTNQFVFVGRLDKLKGVDLLLEAWKCQKVSPNKLIICGTGPLDKWCNDFVRKHKLTTVELKGFVSNQEVKQLLGDSKALIFPTQWYEGFPMTIIEAYGMGTPIIVGNIGNAGGLVQDGVTGFKFVFNSVESLLRNLKKMEISDVEAFGKKSYAIYRNNFSEYINYQIIREIYKK